MWESVLIPKIAKDGALDCLFNHRAANIQSSPTRRPSGFSNPLKGFFADAFRFFLIDGEQSGPLSGRCLALQADLALRQVREVNLASC